MDFSVSLTELQHFSRSKTLQVSLMPLNYVQSDISDRLFVFNQPVRTERASYVEPQLSSDWLLSYNARNLFSSINSSIYFCGAV